MDRKPKTKNLKFGQLRFSEKPEIEGLERQAREATFKMRQGAGLSQGQLAEYLQVLPGRVSQMESPSYVGNTTMDSIERVAKACGYNVSLIITKK